MTITMTARIALKKKNLTGVSVNFLTDGNYELLAVRKRKALTAYKHKQSKKKREEENILDEIMEDMNFELEQGNAAAVDWYLPKALAAEPEDISLRLLSASRYIELKIYEKAAKAYEEVFQLLPDNIEACISAAKLYKQLCKTQCFLVILEDYLKYHTTKADPIIIDMLTNICIENGEYARALQHIEGCFLGIEWPLNLTAKQESATFILEILSLEHYEYALHYYLVLGGNKGVDDGTLNLKIAQCYQSLEKKEEAIQFFYRAVHSPEDNVDVPISIASLLLQERKEKEAISLLSPPVSEKKRLSWSGRIKRARVLENNQVDDLFQRFNPPVTAAERAKAAIAKRELKRRTNLKGEMKLKALATAKALASRGRYEDALDVCKWTLNFASDAISSDNIEELTLLGVQMAYNVIDPGRVWNYYFRALSNMEIYPHKHFRVFHRIQKEKECVPPIIISGYQYSVRSEYQAAAEEYLHAYKLLPDSPFINLCVGTALINLAFDVRLKNKHQCVVQGMRLHIMRRCFLFEKRIILSPRFLIKPTSQRKSNASLLQLAWRSSLQPAPDLQDKWSFGSCTTGFA
ncbi:hypothetical protein HAX54_013430 [Datura stramonium]|uniref:Uncharacterized protein n=1 Tax=Datura stramonium TaxID=4076 RepID=A0ABS8RYA0_DATST|nr:hypothetical protein [Datura stramonium]